jgi:hypothetical protein
MLRENSPRSAIRPSPGATARPPSRLPAAGDFVLVLEREQRRAGRHLSTSLHGELLQRAGKRSGDAHILAFDVSLQGLLGTRTAGAEQAKP